MTARPTPLQHMYVAFPVKNNLFLYIYFYSLFTAPTINVYRTSFIWVFVCFFMFRNILCFPIKDEEGKSPFFFSWELYNGLLFVLLKYNILSCLITDVIGVAQLCNKTNGMLTKIRISLNVFWSNINYHYEKILVWL